MIQVQELFKRFGVFEALKGVSFSIGPGESVALLGENGAGKTTTMRILAGFLPPTRGSVHVAGHDVVFESMAARRAIGYMPESVPLYGGMRVDEFLRYRARLKGLRGSEVKRRVERVLDLVQMTPRRRSLIQTLSKGLRQRVGLADALVHEPPLLILDEPTSGLDPSQRVEVRELIRSLRTHHTVLISTHILPEVEATCDRVILIHEGTVAADTSVSELGQLGSGHRFAITIKGDIEVAQTALATLSRLTIERSEPCGESLFLLHVIGDDEVESRIAAAQALSAADVGIVEIRPLVGGLERAFLALTNREEALGS